MRRRRHSVVDEHAERPLDRYKLNEPPRETPPNRKNLSFVGRTPVNKTNEMIPCKPNLFLVQPVLECVLINNYACHIAHTLLYDEII